MYHMLRSSFSRRPTNMTAPVPCVLAVLQFCADSVPLSLVLLLCLCCCSMNYVVADKRLPIKL
jgi:hypothetical protein